MKKQCITIHRGHLIPYSYEPANGNNNNCADACWSATDAFDREERQLIEDCIEKCVPRDTVTYKKLRELQERTLKLEAQVAKLTLHINELESEKMRNDF